MNVAPVLDFLQREIGLNPESIGAETIEKAVREQMNLVGAARVGDYAARMFASPELQKALIESVVIPETSFFRNKTPFVTLRKYLERFVLRSRPDRTIRILCVPCSTGEEPYSIAMVLFGMKLPPERFSIFAADISEQSLKIAEAGKYSAYSFRGKDVDFRDRYFIETEGGYLLKQEVRDVVQFGQANILADHFLANHAPYDVIFCRNLLIYFDDENKGRALKALVSHLAEDGVLFVGHAEGAKIHQFRLVSLDYPMSFAFAREKRAREINEALGNLGATTISTPAIPAPTAPLPRPVAAPKSAPVVKAAAPVAVQSEPRVAQKKEEGKEDAKGRSIADAMKLADQGAFAEVVAICEGLLAKGAEPAEVYYLLGQAAGEMGNSLLAEEYLRKAIYLNSEFHDALLYLSILFDRMGNQEKSAAFRKRAERVYERTAAK